jgi:hypothetical protein
MVDKAKTAGSASGAEIEAGEFAGEEGVTPLGVLVDGIEPAPPSACIEDEVVAVLRGVSTFVRADLAASLSAKHPGVTLPEIERSIGRARIALCKEFGIEFVPIPGRSGVYTTATATQKFRRAGQFERTAARKVRRAGNVLKAIDLNDVDPDVAARVSARVDKNQAREITLRAVGHLRSPPVDGDSSKPGRGSGPPLEALANLVLKKKRGMTKTPKQKNKVTT